MGFWLFMLAFALQVPAVLVVFGVLMEKKPPQEISRVYGYRTARSMQNAETWLFAHLYCGRLWRRMGIVLGILTVLAFLLLLGRPLQTIALFGLCACLGQTAALVLTFLPVELKLKQTFDTDGQRLEGSDML